MTVFRTMTDADFARMRKWIETEDPPTEEIDAAIARDSREMPVLPPASELPPKAAF